MHFRVKISAQTLAHNEITESQYLKTHTNKSNSMPSSILSCLFINKFAFTYK